MKHKSHLILPIVLAVAVLAGCVLLAMNFAGAFAPEPAVGFLRPSAGSAYVDEAALKTIVEEHGLPFYAADADGSYSAPAQQLAEQGARALVISLDVPLPQADRPVLQQLAVEQGITLLFAGRYPGDSFLEECRNLAWYVGSEPAHAGELMGKDAAMLYRDGTAPDLNADNLLQFAWLSGEEANSKAELKRYTLEGCEHYGVYPAAVSSVQEKSDVLAETALTQWQALEVRPEILLCSNAFAARTALDVRGQLGWNDIPVTAVAANQQEAQALAKEGVAALCYYDLTGVTMALSQMADNTLDQLAINEGTGLVPSGNSFLLPYLPYES